MSMLNGRSIANVVPALAFAEGFAFPYLRGKQRQSRASYLSQAPIYVEAPASEAGVGITMLSLPGSILQVSPTPAHVFCRSMGGRPVHHASLAGGRKSVQDLSEAFRHLQRGVRRVRRNHGGVALDLHIRLHCYLRRRRMRRAGRGAFRDCANPPSRTKSSEFDHRGNILCIRQLPFRQRRAITGVRVEAGR